MTMKTRPHLFGLLAGMFLAAGLVVASTVVTRAWLRISESQVITVTGSARRNVVSDLAVWHGSWVVESGSLLEAQQAVEAARKRVIQFLGASGATNFTISTIQIAELRPRVANSGDAPPPVSGYRLSQEVLVNLDDMDLVQKLDEGCIVLVRDGLVFTTSAPQFIYSKAGEAKVEMLAEATDDAMERARQIAGKGGRRLGNLRSARMGVFQINPLHGQQTSWDGNSDTTSRDKTITSVVTAVVALD
jgi:uncharacterized protein